MIYKFEKRVDSHNDGNNGVTKKLELEIDPNKNGAFLSITDYVNFYNEASDGLDDPITMLVEFNLTEDEIYELTGALIQIKKQIEQSKK